MTPQSRRQHFGLKLATRLAYRPQQNKKWLEGVQIAIEAKKNRELFLLNRTPKLERYYNSRRTSVAKITHRLQKPREKQATQTLVSRYIEIYDDTPMDLGEGWRRQKKERPAHPVISEGDEMEDSGTRETISNRKQTTLSNFIVPRIGTEQIPKRLKG